MKKPHGEFRSLGEVAPEEAASLVEDFQHRHRVWLTLHDVVGVLELPDGTALLPRAYFSHRHPVCRKGRPTADAAAEVACLAHCWRAAHAFGSKAEVPFEHRCWRGRREMVMPVFDDDAILCLVLFIGPRGNDGPGPPKRQQALAWEAHAIGRRLMRFAEALQGLAPEGDRKRLIRRLLAFHAHEPVGLDVVAGRLGVSASRASHLVTDLFGKPWRELLVDVRMERAKRLLDQLPLKVAQVASLCGYADANLFGRLFRNRTGQSPGQWRRARQETAT